eukprot:UN01985
MPGLLIEKTFTAVASTSEGAAHLEQPTPQLVPPSNETNGYWMEQKINLDSLGLKAQIIRCLRIHIIHLQLISLHIQHRSGTSYWAKVRVRYRLGTSMNYTGYCHIKYYIGIPDPMTGEYPAPKLYPEHIMFPVNYSTPMIFKDTQTQ